MPERCLLKMQELLNRISCGRTLQPFHPSITDLLADFSQVLLQDPTAKRFPDLTALGFALRPGNVESLRIAFQKLAGTERVLQPRGTVFQIAAGNVDTLFIHAWAFALLTGNQSIIRLPSKATDTSEFLCDTLNHLLQERPILREANHFVRYAQNNKITTSLSAVCDVRTVWGSDATVNAVRSIPLGTHARELVFPDRFSLAAIESAKYLHAAPAVQRRVVHDFYNDTFSFDQAACSSPRLLIWCGAPDESKRASECFLQALEAEAAERAQPIDPAIKMNKFVFACDAAVQQKVSAWIQKSYLTVLQLADLKDLPREHCGGGLLFQFFAPDLTCIAKSLGRKDQTLVYFGFDQKELSGFAQDLNGKAIDRMVPIGQALAFDRYWDGHDLLAEFTRSIAVV